MTSISSSDRVVLIRPAKLGPSARTAEQLYEATRGWWTVGTARMVGGELSPEHALAVVDGKVVAAFRIDGWETRANPAKAAFVGFADRELERRYLGADVSRYFPKGAQNPLRFVNCPPAVEVSPRLVGDTTPDLSPDPARLDQALRTLEDEPLAAIMFGHRELFHSNLLAWFFRALPETADRVFQPPTGPCGATERNVTREHLNIDVWMDWRTGESHAIENKVFSLPNNKQLDDYTDRIQTLRPGAAMTLLSLSNPVWEGDRRESVGGWWTWMSYTQLAERILEHLPDQDSYPVQTMRHYAHMVTALSLVVQECVVGDLYKSVDLPPRMASRISSPPLSSALRKMRARRVAAMLQSDLLERTGVDALVDSDFRNGSAIITCAIELDTAGSGVPPRVGFQLQGNQFRLMAILEHLSTKAGGMLAGQVAWGSAHAWVFEFDDELDELLGSTGLAMPNAAKGFNKFAPDFIYRYKKVPALTYLQLLDAALLVTRKAQAQRGPFDNAPTKDVT
jgi:hypothetical protein